jgi:ubiquinone/menaquinone biosynthesis C-methylase UbiE
MSHEEKEREQAVASFQSSEEVARYAKLVTKQSNAFDNATQLMLEAAGVRPGDHVLDLAAGTGDQSLSAARKVGATGTVLATDISAEMLKLAARTAEQEGVTTITTRVMNAEQLELADESFDAVICRLGLMMVDLQKTLPESLRVLKPQRKLAGLVWSTLESHALFSILMTTAARYDAAPTLLPNPFSLGKPGVFEQALKEAGFHDVSVQAVSIQIPLASRDEIFQLIPNVLLTSITERFSQQDQQRWREEVRQALSQFEGPEGLTLPAEMLLGEGMKEAF